MVEYAYPISLVKCSIIVLVLMEYFKNFLYTIHYGDLMGSLMGVVASAAGGGVAAGIIATRVNVGGVIIVLEPREFLSILSKLKEKGAIVIHGVRGVFSKSHIYLIPYQGVVFVTKSKNQLPVSPDIEARNINMPYPV